MSGLAILSLAPGATLQDRGRPGWLRFGVSAGGAMDRYALAEGQALLGNGPDDAALELPLAGGRFRALADVTVATSGAVMALSVNGAPRPWRQGLRLRKGDLLEIGAAQDGVYGYLHLPGGIDSPVVMGARSTHLRAGLGRVPMAGERLDARAPDRDCPILGLPRPDYFDRRQLRFLRGPQSRHFPAGTLARFLEGSFDVSASRDRMGVQILPEHGPVRLEAGLSIASDAILDGDIQITGDGTPAVMMAERGTSGGYPRIGTLAAADRIALAQMPSGARFTLEEVDRKAALAALEKQDRAIAALAGRAAPVVVDPRDISDLLAYNLIDGVLRGDEDDQN